MAKKARVWDGSQWVDLASAVTDMTQYANLNTTPISGFRNTIINGGFDVWQRGTSFAAAGYTADRFAVVVASGQTIASSQQAFTAGNPISGYEPTYFLRNTWSGTPSGTFWLTQRVEDVRTFAGQTVTLSFWAKAGSATTALNPYIEQNFGSGGSASVGTSGTAISLTTSWQRFTQTFNIPSISGKTIGTSSYLDVRPFMGSTSVAGNAIDIWGVQLEKGSIATPFEQRPIGTELALCQRYYYRRNSYPAIYGSLAQGFGRSTTLIDLYVWFPVPMRAIPTSYETTGFANDYEFESAATIGVPTVFNAINSQYSTVNVVRFSVTGTSIVVDRPYLLTSNGFVGNYYLGFTAEL